MDFMRLWYSHIKLWIKRWILKKSVPFDEKKFFEGAVRHSRDNILKPLETIIKLKGLKILDIGCGYGGAIECLKTENQITGIELNENRARFAIKNFKDAKNVKILNGNVFECRLKENRYDLIIAADVFEHISDYNKLMRLISLSLRDNGIAYISFTPYYGAYGSHVMHYFPIPYIHIMVPRKWICSLINRMGDFNSVINARFVSDQFAQLNRLKVGEFRRMASQNEFMIIKEWNLKWFGMTHEYFGILRKTPTACKSDFG